ncbi:nuclear transport factor 2 family protein [Saccharomonospora sp. NPDC006951]
MDQRERVHDTITRYLRLCDVPKADGERGELAELFTDDVVWEGIGSAYAGKFGRTRGKQAVADMVGSYLPPNPHFESNVHILGQGTVELTGTSASGCWLMQQISHYRTGERELMVARLEVDFRLTPRRALISRFRTQRLTGTALPG